ncbi:YwdI family protein [Oceanobacillus bengalensis]|uniref:YwdI family protein n=1 Tax=Oceanobacillus bengalensis TaxID=1435466 RepID=A0A494YYV7_9BACI|nr:YwdI family protein [Oceanobacillus bengalensis]RKQ15419.1 hypothetical protein D8M05_10510 [Oceanobacillus bengalensis]
MAIANEKIIKKMIHELYQAKESEQSYTKMVRHISNVKLLCELFLEEDQTQVTDSDTISDEEIKAMLGASVGTASSNQDKIKRTYQPEEDANGSSIFDF